MELGGTCPALGDGLIDTVNARDLHRGLKVGKDFTTWVKGRIEACQFQEDQDYVVFDSPVLGNQVCHGGDRRSKSYFLTLDAAKHFAMMEKDE